MKDDFRNVLKTSVNSLIERNQTSSNFKSSLAKTR
jgi:hypothetical protein